MGTDKKRGKSPDAKAIGEPEPLCHVLRLYVTGTTPNSRRAIENVRRICEEHLKGRYKLDVVDIYRHPSLASDEQILAAPTLIKKLPLPLRRLIGDMSNEEKVLFGLDLRPIPEPGTKK